MGFSNNRQSSLHSRNLHQGRYDFAQLTKVMPDLANYTRQSPRGDLTVDFSDSQAVIALNKALLATYYGVKLWDLPEGYLCPPIPSRADYIHHMADLLIENNGRPLTGKQVHALDIGTGASCIYPIIGSQAYGWSFTATDIDPVSVNTAKTICAANANLKSLIRVKQQLNANHIFKGVVEPDDVFDMTVCNPPFYASLAEAQASNQRKQHNLKRSAQKKGRQYTHQTSPPRNFGGQQAELWCQGGELAFLKNMVRESTEFGEQVGWFSSLVSQNDNVRPLERLIKKNGASRVEVIPMQHGQKATRVLAWSYINKK